MPLLNWRPVIGYAGFYEVSDQGHVRSLDRVTASGPRRGKLLKPQILNNSAKHLQVSLSRYGNARHRLIHQLVLEAFVGPRPPGLECRHLNDDSTDNRLSNLVWGTRSENLHDMVRNGKHTMAAKTHCVNGHEYTPSNTLRNNKGARVCRNCVRQHARDQRAKAKIAHASS
jgi:hypothetical protein